MLSNAITTDAVDAMVSKDVGCVVILDAERVAGVVTERDVMRALRGDDDLKTKAVADIMSAPVITGTEVDVYDAFQLMAEKGIRRAAVVEEQRRGGSSPRMTSLRWVRDVAQE